MDTKPSSPDEEKIVVSETESRWKHLGRWFAGLPKAVKRLALALGILVAVWLVAYGIFHYITTRPVTIGDTTITHKQFVDYANAIKNFTKDHNEDFGGTPMQAAQNDLILNAALKNEAKKYHVTVTQDDIDASLQNQYDALGGKQNYQDAVSGRGLTDVMKVRNENTVYESKLHDNLIAGKKIFLVDIPFDTSFFNSVKSAKDRNALVDLASQTLSKKFLPLFQQKLPKEQIAAQADIDTFKLSSPSNSTAPFVDNHGLYIKMFVSTMYVPEITADQNYFNDQDTDTSVSNRVSANDTVKKLNTVGQYTGVVTTKAGFVGIFRLEGKTSGAYSSWDQFLQQYKSKYAKHLTAKSFPGALFGVAAHAVKPLGDLYKSALHLVWPKAAAVTSFGVSCSGHYASFTLHGKDEITGGSISVHVTESRTNVGCPNKNGKYVGTTIFNDQISGQPGDGPNSGNTTVTFYDNCENPGPTWNETTPSGYTWKPGDDYDPSGVIDNKSGWPNWGNGNINSVSNVTWYLMFVGDWTLKGTTLAGATTVAPGATVTFTHKVTNQGPAPAKYDWKVQSRYIPNGGSATAWSASGLPSGSPNSVPKGSSVPSAATVNYSFPSNAKDGDQYCERVQYTNATGPSTGVGSSNGTGATDGTGVCVKLVLPNGKPTGTVTITCNADGTATANGTFSDADGSATYPVKATVSGGVPVVTTATNGKTNPLKPANETVPSSKVASFTLSIPDVGPNAKAANNFTKTFTKPCAGGTTTGPGCPSLPNPIVTVSLPDQAPSSSAPSGSTTTPSASYYQDTPQSKTVVTGVNDVSSGGVRVGIAAVPGSEGYQTVQVDYSPYVADYPYDQNQASVTYDSYYNETYWYSSSSVDWYNCGGVNNGTNSTCTGSSSYSASCQPGDSGPGFLGCVHNDGTASSTGKCPSSSDVTGGPGQPCYTFYTPNYCPSGGTASSGTCTYTYTYTGTAEYDWHQGATTNNLTKSNTAYGQLMNACWDRGFSVTNVSASTSLLPDPEDPETGSSAGSATIVFSYTNATPADGLRQPMQVTLSYDSSGDCPAPGGNFTATGGYGAGTTTVPVGSGSCTATAPPLQPGDTICTTYTVSPTGTTMDISGNVTNDNGGSLSGTGCSAAVSNEPYFHAYGLDVMAGGAFDTANNKCQGASMTNSGIAAFVRGTGPLTDSGNLTRGSGSQLGALALGSVQTISGSSYGFSSAMLRSSDAGSPTGRDGLTFANTPAGTLGNLGGTACVPDYYATMPGTATGGPIDPTKDGVYSLPAGSTISGLTISDGAHIAVYVQGNVAITGDIKFQNSAWTTTDKIPSFYLVAKGGTVFIGPGVGQLDGVYVSEPDNTGAGGTINTCGDTTNFTRQPTGSLYNNCSGKQLVVNGSFIAQTVQLDRTYASLRNALGGEYPFSAPGDCSASDKGSPTRSDPTYDCAAEIFNFSPETYLSLPAISPVSNPTDGSFDYITSLSPVL